MTPQKIVRKVKNKESNSIQASLKKMIIIIPVFNEGSNIQILLGTLSKKVPHANLLFVDDNSKDDTVKEIKTYSKKMKGKVNILKRSKKLGLGSAYVSAFKASFLKNYDFLLQNADLSHNPMQTPTEFIKEVKKEDFLVGNGISWLQEFHGWGIAKGQDCICENYLLSSNLARYLLNISTLENYKNQNPTFLREPEAIRNYKKLDKNKAGC